MRKKDVDTCISEWRSDSGFFNMIVLVCFKQKTAYEIRNRKWSSDVCSSDLVAACPANQSSQPNIRDNRHSCMVKENPSMQGTAHPAVRSLAMRFGRFGV